MKKMYLLSLLFVMWAGHAAGQRYASQQYTIRDGLPSNSVRSLFKDSRDILWMGTDAGLCTFDGQHIRRVSLPDTLESTKIWALAEDNAGHLWLGTYGAGLIRYDGREFSRYNTPVLINNFIRVLHFSKRFNALMVGTQSGFSMVSETDIFSWVPEGEVGNRFLVMGFFETHDGIVFHTFSHGAFHFNPHTLMVNPLPEYSPLQVRSSSATFVSSHGDTVVGLFKSGLRIVGKEGVKDFHDLGQVFNITEDSRGTLWISAWSYYDMQEPGGLFTYDGQTLQHTGPLWGVDYRMGWSTLHDPHSGALFVATDGEGFFKLIDRGISKYPATHFGAEKLDIYDLKTYQGNLWITAADRVIYGNSQTGFNILDEHFFAQQKMHPAHKTDSAVIRTPGKFLSMHIDTGQNLWIGSTNALYKLSDPGFTRFNLGKRFTENFVVFSDGRAFSGAWSYFRIASNIFESDHYANKNSQPDFPVDVNRIISRENELWFSSFAHGLYRYKNNQFTRYSNHQPDLPRNLSTLCLDGYSRLVAGTQNGKVIILEGSDSLQIKHSIDESDGLVGNEVLWLLCDSKNRLWAGTDMGINIIDLNLLHQTENLTIRHIDESEGFYDFVVRSAIQDEAGIIWLGGKDNLVRIDPEKLLHTPLSPQKIELTGFTVNFREVAWDSITEANVWRNIPTGNVVLSYRQNNLTFRFGAYNLLNPEKVIYSCLLEGFSKEPTAYSQRSDITFTNLAPGNYTFKINALNMHSGEDYQPLELRFRISPPWYRTWYFYTALTLAILAVILLVMRFRILRVKAIERMKLEHERRLNSMRIQAIQAQMNPHFVFNVLSSIQNFMLDNDMDSSLEYLNDFSALIRKTMENISEESILLSEEIIYLKRYIKLENLRLGNSMHFFIRMDKKLTGREIQIPPMIIQPFVENAIKHGLAPKEGLRILLLSFELKDNMLQIRVCDNGVGLQGAKQTSIYGISHKSAGIKNTTERIQHYIHSHSEETYPKLGVKIRNRESNGKIKGVMVNIGLPVTN